MDKRKPVRRAYPPKREQPHWLFAWDMLLLTVLAAVGSLATAALAAR